MKRNIGHNLSALAAGLVFGAGLVISGMTQPNKVLGFLDPLGAFDASLVFVMLGAIALHFIAYRVSARRTAPLYGAKFLLPTRRDVDAKLLAGAFVFGAGWGLGGYCPGPGIVSLAGGGAAAMSFVGAMLLGLYATIKAEAMLARYKARVAASSAPAASDSVTHTRPLRS